MEPETMPLAATWSVGLPWRILLTLSEAVWILAMILHILKAVTMAKEAACIDKDGSTEDWRGTILFIPAMHIIMSIIMSLLLGGANIAFLLTIQKSAFVLAVQYATQNIIANAGTRRKHPRSLLALSLDIDLNASIQKLHGSLGPV